MQNMFVNAYKSLDQYDEYLPFSTWLYTIAKNQFCNHYQHKKRLHESKLIESEIDDPQMRKNGIRKSSSHLILRVLFCCFQKSRGKILNLESLW
ncbi:MAG: hypothetical protein LBV46_00385 [Bacteroidales bacterium]|nr:hypothetical protein [Bacteroidales bacterium]